MNTQKFLERAGVPTHLLIQAHDSIEEARNLSRSIMAKELAAPFVMALVVPRVPWEANRLPEKYSAYDTEPLTHIDINGDLKQWVEVDGVGVPLPVPLDREPLPRNDKGEELCYYAKGHHGRSKWARWIWLGTRNRAQRAAYDLGPAYDPDIEEWGFYGDGETIMVYRMGKHWQIMATKRVLRFIQIRRNVGFKIKNIMKGDQRTIDPSIPVRASVAWTPWSAKRWKH